MAWHSSTSVHAKETIIHSLPLRISCNRQTESGKGAGGMEWNVSCRLQVAIKTNLTTNKKEAQECRASTNGWFTLKTKMKLRIGTFYKTCVVVLNAMQGNIFFFSMKNNPGNPHKGATQSGPTVPRFWLGSASPAEVLMLLGLEQTVREPSCQK